MGRRKNDFQRPEWFALEKYDGVHDLDIEGWFVQVNRRLRFPGEEPGDEYEKRFWERQVEVRENPVGPDPRYIPTESRDLWNQGVVRLATPHHLWLHKPMELHGIEFETLLEWERECLRAMSAREQWLDEPLNNSTHAAKLPLLSINLAMPDDLLISGFAELLKQLRHRKPWKEHRPVDLRLERQEWCARAILPYWDLRLWAEETGTIITQREYARVLFDESASESDIVKHTKPKAEKVFSADFADFLGAFFVHETAGNIEGIRIIKRKKK